MEWFESRRKTKLHNANTRRGLPIHGNVSWARPFKSHNNTEDHHYPKRHRYNKHLYTISTLVLSLLSPTARIRRSRRNIRHSQSNSKFQWLGYESSYPGAAGGHTLRILMVMVSSAKVLP
ncbi:MAG: hypothetical protein CM15mV20_2590 [uncultured marine virus]|nr:MAG: hypothetical protein CM15mV20_2590 [uncultured marine virus]